MGLPHMWFILMNNNYRPVYGKVKFLISIIIVKCIEFFYRLAKKHQKSLNDGQNWYEYYKKPVPIAEIHERSIMDIQTLTTFFKWCTIINGGILVSWAVCFIFAPDLVYRIQSKWFPIPRETFNVVIYSFFGVFKIFFLMFNVVPYVALLIMG